MRALAYDARGRSQPRERSRPPRCFDLMFLTDYLPPLRATIPIAVHAALAGDGAPLARLLRESTRFDAIGSPRDFSVARYATTCETTPVPWDAGTPLDQRPAIIQQRIAALPAGTFAPFDAGGRHRGRDRPLPALAGRPAPRLGDAPRRAVSRTSRP